MIGNSRYGRLGLFMLPVKAADTLQPVYGLTAAALLIGDLATGHGGVALAITGVIAAKIALDLCFHLWSVLVFRRWLGVTARTSLPSAVLASLIEPFCFQILRHLGAASGWIVYLTGRSSWGRQTRGGLAASARSVDVPSGPPSAFRALVRQIATALQRRRRPSRSRGSRASAIIRCVPPSADQGAATFVRYFQALSRQPALFPVFLASQNGTSILRQGFPPVIIAGCGRQFLLRFRPFFLPWHGFQLLTS